MASPSRIRELRYLSGTTFNESFTAANAAAWAPGTATKLRITEYDGSGLVSEGVEDPTLHDHILARSEPLATKRSGTVSFGLPLGHAESSSAENPVATFLGEVLGGIDTPTTRSYTALTGGTTTNVKATGINSDAVVGSGVLLGTKGDGRGNGEVRRVVALSTDTIAIDIPIQAALNAGDTITLSTTVYMDVDTTQKYIDLLAIGKAAHDQVQTIGGQVTSLSLDGTALGELPTVKCEYTCADWQNVPSGELDQLEPGSAAQGNGYPGHRGMGGIFIVDRPSSSGASASARNAPCGGGVGVDSLGVTYQPVPCINGVNGLGGFAKVGQEIGVSVSLLHEEAYALWDDFENDQAKSLILQWGYAPEACVAISIPNAHLAESPKKSDLDGLSAYELKFMADRDSYGSTALRESPIAIYWF